MAYIAHGFVDGAYLRANADKADLAWVDPHRLVASVALQSVIQEWGDPRSGPHNAALTRVVYYDARPDAAEDTTKNLREYWSQIELLPDTHLGFGSLRGGTRSKPPRQKGVDTMMAVDMVVGAVDKLFDIAILIAGDADFVPVVREVRRRGVMVALAADRTTMSDDLRRVVDRFVEIGPGREPPKNWFPPLFADGKTWKSNTT